MKQLRNLENKRRKLRKPLGHRRENVKEFTNHRVSREISNFSSKFPNSIVIFEKGLGKLKKTTWSPADVKTKTEYKLKANNISTFDIHPAYTSQICSHCGAIGTRTKGMVYFSCNSRGLGVGSNPSSTIGQYNADVNASINIALRGLHVLTLIGKTVGYEDGAVAEPNEQPDRSIMKPIPTAMIDMDGKDTQEIEKLPDETNVSRSSLCQNGQVPVLSFVDNQHCLNVQPMVKVKQAGSAPENDFSSSYKGFNKSLGRTELEQETDIGEVLSQSKF